MTQQKYVDHLGIVPRELVGKWFLPRARERQDIIDYRGRLVLSLYRDVIHEIWLDYKHYVLSGDALGRLVQSTWQNSTGRNLTTWEDFNEFRTFLLRATCSRPGLSEMLYALMGPQCANESNINKVSELQTSMMKIASIGTFNDFLIRYNNYDEAAYKTFAKDISTFIYHEVQIRFLIDAAINDLRLTMIGFCIGISRENDVKREQRRSTQSEQIRGIVTYMLEARFLLSEEPPPKPEVPSSEAVKTEITNSLAKTAAKLASLPWKERPAFYDSAIRDAVRNLKLDYNSSDISSIDGVMYLPYEVSNTHVHSAHAIDNGSYPGSIAEKAIYFVKYTQTALAAQTLKDKFRALEAKKDRIIKTVFAKSQDGLCKRVQSVLDDQRLNRKRREIVSDVLGEKAFSAFVAVKCSYDFMWYELGRRYYTAARTTSDYVLEKNGGTFDANCGQIIFLP